MNMKCKSCRRAFFQSGGYMPCSCNKEATPEFVPPPPLIALDDSEFKIIHPWFYHAAIYFVLGLIVGIVGCLYATSHIP